MKSSVRRSSRLATSSTASARKAVETHLAQKNHGYEGSGVVCPRYEQTAKFRLPAQSSLQFDGSGAVRARYY